VRWFVLLAVVTLALPAAAAAKGAQRVRIVGPGLARPIVLVNDAGPSGEALRALQEESGLLHALFDAPPDPARLQRPAGVFGPAYTATYRVVGPYVWPVIKQTLYPYATPWPLAYVAPGQSLWDGRRAPGGWFVATPRLRSVLVALGLPSVGSRHAFARADRPAPRRP
jgi:hypothetical protein